MRFIGYAAYPLAAALFAQNEPSLALLAVILMGWLVVLSRFERQLVPNEGPWNEPEALKLALTVLPTMTIGLALFAPVYATWAIQI